MFVTELYNDEDDYDHVDGNDTVMMMVWDFK
jgi:hypothetical protein